MVVDSFTALLALNRLKGIKNREKLILLEIFDNPERIFHLSLREVQGALGRKLRSWNPSPDSHFESALRDREYLDKNRGGVIFFWDREYPPQLREIYDPPFMLFYRGVIPVFNNPGVGIVGTRYPSGEARKGAYRLASELAAEGIPIISGLARGVDGEAHTGAMDQGGITLGVMGNGIDSIYPLSHKALGRRILEEGGTLLSEFAPGTPPLRYNFPLRNRIISGLSRSIVVIQAPLKSGALITADYALDQGRDIFVHTAGAFGPGCEGTIKLVESGAPVIENAARLFYDWNWNLPSVCIKNEEFPCNPGIELAWRLRQELDGEAILHNGDFFRR